MNFLVGLVVLCGCALYTDITTMRIPNKLNLFFAVAGVALHMITSGLPGFAVAIYSCLSGFIPMLLLHFCRAVAAGDVKFFAVVGIWAGTWITLYAIIYAIFIAGMIGLFYWFSMPTFWRGLWMFIRYRCSFVMPHKRFPFMIAAAPGVLIALLHFNIFD